MKVCDGIKVLQECYRSCDISNFDFEEIRAFIISDPTRSAHGYRLEGAISTIDLLVSNGKMTSEMGDILKKAVHDGDKEAPQSNNVYDYYPTNNSTPTNTVSKKDEFEIPKKEKSEENKSLKGGLVGFLLTFFTSLIGFILALCLGDKKCKHAATITFVAQIILALVIVLIFGIIFLVDPNIIFPGGL